VSRPAVHETIDVRDISGGAELRVRVMPRAARDGLGGVRQGALVVRLTAPPVEGAANAALARVLGKLLGVPPSAVDLARGSRGRDKVLRIVGRTAAEVTAALMLHLG
jgi:uncharacterized protein (TIGR00251 family)